MLRVFGALAIVIGIFLGGVWLFRNWQRVLAKRGAAPRLLILESRPLGHRHGLHVIGYEHQRLLIASSPTGVTLISPLADAAPPGERHSAESNHPAGHEFRTHLTRALRPGTNGLDEA